MILKINSCIKLMIYKTDFLAMQSFLCLEKALEIQCHLDKVKLTVEIMFSNGKSDIKSFNYSTTLNLDVKRCIYIMHIFCSVVNVCLLILIIQNVSLT